MAIMDYIAGFAIVGVLIFAAIWIIFECLSARKEWDEYDPEKDPSTAAFLLKQYRDESVLKPLDRNSAIMQFGENLVYEKDKCVRCGRRYLKIEAGLCKLCKKKGELKQCDQ